MLNGELPNLIVELLKFITEAQNLNDELLSLNAEAWKLTVEDKSSTAKVIPQSNLKSERKSGLIRKSKTPPTLNNDAFTRSAQA